ncbi:barstar family protein [Brevibacillus sp. FIR094]|uniref:barstar family protein n=1 Tax=Brevibacillus sp. FIR094 TaxID=3134809 RepID=UPI003D1EDD8B
MVNKFSLIDDESDLVIGNCSDLIGLTGNCTEKIDNEVFHKITLLDFRFNDDFKVYCKKTKTYINNLYLAILNNEGNPIGSYYYYLKEPHYFHRYGFGEGLTKLELIGTILQVASEEGLEIWEMRRSSLPKRNLWTILSKKQRIGWLEVARLHYNTIPNSPDQQNGKYDIEASNVSDSSSFFCALGEAINGPGGYYGFDLLSLKDCLCGGFGAVPPFTIHLRNGNDSSKLRVNNNDLVLEEDETFFQQLNDLLLVNNVTLIRE